jgi:hypothetical protein
VRLLESTSAGAHCHSRCATLASASMGQDRHAYSPRSFPSIVDAEPQRGGQADA